MEDNDRACQLEAVLFAAGEPVSAQQLCSKLDISQEQLRAAAEKLSDYYLYERRGLRLLYLTGHISWCLRPSMRRPCARYSSGAVRIISRLPHLRC